MLAFKLKHAPLCSDAFAFKAICNVVLTFVRRSVLTMQLHSGMKAVQIVASSRCAEVESGAATRANCIKGVSREYQGPNLKRHGTNLGFRENGISFPLSLTIVMLLKFRNSGRRPPVGLCFQALGPPSRNKGSSSGHFHETSQLRRRCLFSVDSLVRTKCCNGVYNLATGWSVAELGLSRARTRALAALVARSPLSQHDFTNSSFSCTHNCMMAPKHTPLAN